MFGKRKKKEKPENIIDAENYKIEDVETDEEKSKEEKEMKKINKKGGIISGVATLLIGAGVLAATLLRKPEIIDCTKDDDLDDDFDDVFEAPEESGETTE